MKPTAKRIKVSVRTFLAMAIALGVLAGWNLYAAGAKPTVKSIGDGVVCQCSCNMTVNSCNHEQCASRSEMQELAQKEIKAGKDETTILQDFVLRYGVKVLSSPPATGFNYTVWILPGLGLIVGLAVAILLVRRWRRPPERAAATGSPPASNTDPNVLAAVEEEMKAAGLDSGS